MVFSPVGLMMMWCNPRVQVSERKCSPTWRESHSGSGVYVESVLIQNNLFSPQRGAGIKSARLKSGTTMPQTPVSQ